VAALLLVVLLAQAVLVVALMAQQAMLPHLMQPQTQAVVVGAVAGLHRQVPAEMEATAAPASSSSR
jgi:hypothetical protein